MDMPNLSDNLRMKEYINNLKTNVWTMAEFDKECSYWFISCQDLYPLKYPEKPSELKEYATFTTKEKSQVTSAFWNQGSVRQYNDQCSRVEGHNKGIVDKLKEFKSYIPEQDITTISKYNTAIARFEAPEEVREIAEVFGGRGF